mmetsp:Transcript_7402/g.23694  ORF Transcript_7402/g.23694 Transcript_7402/m.23694 type:complete len:263 (+) Transcript_7402:110-898(+)
MTTMREEVGPGDGKTGKCKSMGVTSPFGFGVWGWAGARADCRILQKQVHIKGGVESLECPVAGETAVSPTSRAWATTPRCARAGGQPRANRAWRAAAGRRPRVPAAAHAAARATASRGWPAVARRHPLRRQRHFAGAGRGAARRRCAAWPSRAARPCRRGPPTTESGPYPHPASRPTSLRRRRRRTGSARSGPTALGVAGSRRSDPSHKPRRRRPTGTCRRRQGRRSRPEPIRTRGCQIGWPPPPPRLGAPFPSCAPRRHPA